MTETNPESDLATPQQEEEAKSLAESAGEEVPGGMRAAEANQRIVELETQQDS